MARYLKGRNIHHALHLRGRPALPEELEALLHVLTDTGALDERQARSTLYARNTTADQAHLWGLRGMHESCSVAIGLPCVYGSAEKSAMRRALGVTEKGISGILPVYLGNIHGLTPYAHNEIESLFTSVKSELPPVVELGALGVQEVLRDQP